MPYFDIPVDLNLLDWGNNNLLALALGGGAYAWNADTGSIHHLLQMTDDEYVSSVSWIGAGNILAIGNCNGQVMVSTLAQFWGLFFLRIEQRR